MQLNIPPRLMRVAALCSVATVLLLAAHVLIAPEVRLSWKTAGAQRKYAYAQYATTMDYLCNAAINFALLRRHGAKHDLVLIYPIAWSQGESVEAKAIFKLQNSNPEIKFRPFDIISTEKGEQTWRDSLTKFNCFALTEWDRVLAFDSDSLVLNSMDEYFLSPRAPVAVPRAYWLTEGKAEIAKQVLDSHVMLIEPNQERFRKILDDASKTGDFDMEVINHMFRDSAMILPHRRLALLTGEFRSADHSKYLAPDEDEAWDPVREAADSYLVHFSDWPLPKPWMNRTVEEWDKALPECPDAETTRGDRSKCADRVIWTGFYDMYDRERERECAALYE